MKIKVEINLDELFSDDYSVSELVQDAIKSEILRELKKSKEYKDFISRGVENALMKLVFSGDAK